MRIMALMRLAYMVARRRIASEWRLELAVTFGMVLAVALLAGGVVYSTSLEEAALQRTLAGNPPEDTNVLVRSFQPAGLALSPEIAGLVEREVQEPLEPYLSGSSQFVQTATFYFQGHPQFGTDSKTQARGKLQYVPGFEEQVRLVEGRFPQGEAYPIEVVAEAEGLELIGLSVGDELQLVPSGVVKDPTPLDARIVGAMEVLDASGDFWAGESEALSYQGTLWPWVPVFVTEETFQNEVVQRYPELRTDLSWHFHLDRENLRAREVGRLKRTVEHVRAVVAQDLSNGSSYTGLVRILERHQGEVTLARVPLQLVVSLGVCIILYYVFLVSVLIVRSRAPELALLKSRGATTAQLVVLMFVEGVLLAIPAIAVGPFVSLLVVTTLGRVFSASIAGFNVVPVALSTESFLLGAGGGLLCVLTLTLSALVTARHGIVEFRQVGARPPETSFIHRYYLDLLLLAFIGLLWWQVEQQGSFLVRSLGETGLSMDFSLLLGPVLSFVASGLLVLRFFPLALRVLARLAEPLRFTWLVQALRQMARDPLMPGALLVLLMLAAMLGVVGGTFRSSLEASQRDRALYAAGADVRLTIPRGEAASAFLVAGRGLFMIGENPHSMVYRGSATLTAKGLGQSGTILGVESDAFADVAWYRPGFTSPPVAEVMGEMGLAGAEQQRIELPLFARTLGIWVRPSQPYPGAHLMVRFHDSQGEYFDLDMGSLGFDGWQYLEAELTWMRPIEHRRYQYRGTPPLVIESLFISGNVERGAVFLDQMDTYVHGFDRARGGAYDEDVVLADFQDVEGWHVMEDPVYPGVYALELSEAAARPGRKCVVYSWASRGLSMQGIRPGPDEGPLPALVDNGFLKEADVAVGDTAVLSIVGTSVPIKIIGSAEYFPTLYPDEGPFVVVDLVRLVDYINSRAVSSATGPNELWVRLSETEPDAVYSEIILPLSMLGVRSQVDYIAPEMVSSREMHPLLAAGWSGLLVLCFFTVVLASASSILLYSYMDSRERQMEFALLRTLGFSRGQLNRVVWFGLVLMVTGGVVLGTWVGQMAGSAVLPLLEVAEQGTRVTPPIALRVNWWALLWYYAVLAVAVVATCGILARILARREIQRVLRIGGA